MYDPVLLPVSGQSCQLESEKRHHVILGFNTGLYQQVSYWFHGYDEFGEKCNMQRIDWCEGVLQLSDIGTKNVGEPDLTPRMKYIIVIFEN